MGTAPHQTPAGQAAGHGAPSQPFRDSKASGGTALPAMLSSHPLLVHLFPHRPAFSYEFSLASLKLAFSSCLSLDPLKKKKSACLGHCPFYRHLNKARCSCPDAVSTPAGRAPPVLSAQANRNSSWFDRDGRDGALGVINGPFGSQGAHASSQGELSGLFRGGDPASTPLPTAMLSPHPATGRSAL